MEKTPTFKSKSRHFKKSNNELGNTENNEINTSSKLLENESPNYIPCTQEGFENIDVVWNWNSPQSKKIPKRSQKRLALSQSPKTTLKRHLSNNSIQGFEKLKEELRLLKEEIAVPEHEDSLLLSPVDEAEYKNVNASIHNIELENFINEAEDFFNDSLDEQLLICSTQIENITTNRILQCDNSNYNINNNQIVNKTLQHGEDNTGKSIFETTNKPLHFIDDPIDFEEPFNICSVNTCFNSDKNKPNHSSDNTEFHQTQSLAFSTECKSNGLSVIGKEQIERKRQEALAKLEFKKKQGSSVISPLQCSSEEIEKKRHEALAKREARRQQEIIEKKRQEALKRLEINRQKKTQTLKSSLTCGLNKEKTK